MPVPPTPKPRTPRRHRSAAVVRAVSGLGALLLAAAVGIGGVVGTSALVGPINSDSAPDGGATQVAPTPALPPNTPPTSLLGMLAANAPTPTDAGLQAALAGPLSDPVLGTLAARIVDPATGAVLLDQNSGAALQPASTLKLYTAAAAAIALPEGDRLVTRVVAGEQPGEIVIVAGGDITLSSGPTSTFNPGAATIAQLADAIKAAGVTAVTKITVDDSIFQGPTNAAGWGSQDAPSAFAAPVYPLMVDGGRSVAADDASMRYAEPDLHAAAVLAAALGSPDAQLVRGQASGDAATIAEVKSAPIEQLIEQMMVNSDNTLAEVLGRMVAIELGRPATFDGAVAAVTSVMGELGIDMTAYAAHDTSGLSQLDRTSATSIASLMSLVAAGTSPRLDVVASALPVSGFSGTLADRYDSPPTSAAAGQVRAKTGTLTGVNSLAGTVVTDDGRLLVYSLISNGGGDTASVREALDVIAATIAGCGCR